MEKQIDNYALHTEIKNIVDQALVELNEFGADPEEMIHQICDGHQWVIYTHKALQFCANCDTDEGEDWLDDIGATYSSLAEHASAIVYGTLLTKSLSEFAEANA
jgi:EAL domain-containing protein (putative c-di-GMP-specific phosphodiesterase class I)